MQFRFSVAADSDTADSCLAVLKSGLQQSSSVWPDVSHSAISQTNVLALCRKEKKKERRKKKDGKEYMLQSRLSHFSRIAESGHVTPQPPTVGGVKEQIVMKTRGCTQCGGGGRRIREIVCGG